MTETLFDFVGQRPTLPSWAAPVARRTDPLTSHLAAKKAAPKAETLRAIVLELLRTPSGMTHDELIAALPDWSPSGVRTRCRELVDAGLVVCIGERQSAAGNRSKVWRAL